MRNKLGAKGLPPTFASIKRLCMATKGGEQLGSIDKTNRTRQMAAETKVPLTNQ